MPGLRRPDKERPEVEEAPRGLSRRAQAAKDALTAGYAARAARYVGPNPYGRSGTGDVLLACAWQAGWARHSRGYPFPGLAP